MASRKKRRKSSHSSQTSPRAGRSGRSSSSSAQSNKSPIHTPESASAGLTGRQSLRDQLIVSRMGLVLGILILAAFTIVTYFPVNDAGIIIDDPEFYFSDPVMDAPDGLSTIWFSPADNNDIWPYIPLTRSTFWLERQIFGSDPQASHWINVALHILAAVLLWLALQHLKIKEAWLIALLFAVHPVFVQSVAWIAERKNTVAAIWYILTFWSYLHFDRGRDRRWYVVAIGLFVCALLSKTSTIMLPVLLILLKLWKGPPWKNQDLIYLFPFFVLAAGFGLLRIYFEQHFFGADSGLLDRPFLERILIAGHVPFFYVTKLVWPYPLNFIYSQWNLQTSAWTQYLPWFSHVVIGGVLFWRYASWGKPLFLAWAGFVVALFPVMGWFNNAWQQFSFVADHWVHLPSLSLLILVVLGLPRLEKFGAQWFKTAEWKIVTKFWWGLLIVLGGLTWNHAEIYQNAQTLWEVTLKRNPQAWIAHLELGRLDLQSAQPSEALVRFNKAIELNPQAIHAYNNRGNAFVNVGQWDRALQDFDKVLSLNPEFAEGYSNRAIVFSQVGRFEQALNDIQSALRLKPHYPEAYNTWGTVYADQQNYPLAIEKYNDAIERNPYYDEAYFNRGNAKVGLHQYSEAIQDYNQALNLNPNRVEAYSNRGFAYLQIDQYPTAIQNFTDALKINPQFSDAYLNRAIANELAGRPDAALSDYNQVLLLQPNQIQGYLNRGRLHQKGGNALQACKDWKQACNLGYCGEYEAAKSQQICR